MRRSLLLACLGALSIASLATSGPVDGPKTNEVRVDLAQGAGGEVQPAKYRFKSTFRGGERACIIAYGDHKPVVEMAVTVYDETGKVKIAENVGSADSMDFVAVIWYPPRDTKYVIEVVSHPPRDPKQLDEMVKKGTAYNVITVAQR